MYIDRKDNRSVWAPKIVQCLVCGMMLVVVVGRVRGGIVNRSVVLIYL